MAGPDVTASRSLEPTASHRREYLTWFRRVGRSVLWGIICIGLLVLVTTLGGADGANHIHRDIPGNGRTTLPRVGAGLGLLGEAVFTETQEAPAGLNAETPQESKKEIGAGWQRVSGEFIATRYGESYEGQRLGCGGLYHSSDESILAVGPEREWPCGTRLQVCSVVTNPISSLRCLDVVRVDSCPGCGAFHLDLSEAGIAWLCGLRWPEDGTCDYVAGLSVWQEES